MRTYKVERYGEPLVAYDEEPPVPHGGEVLIEVAASGVCHSDVHLWDGFFDLGDGERIDAARIMTLPRALGHEIAGTVRALGPDATGVRVGARRVVYPWLGCGACDLCRSGREHLCARPNAIGVQRDGGFAQFVLVPDARYLFPFDPLDEAQACTYACAGVTAYAALKKAGPLAPDAHLLIVGAGGVGLSGIRFAQALYDVAPIVADVDRSKWDLALEAGAADTIDPKEDGVARALAKRTGGGVAAAVDFVGSQGSFTFALGALAKGGKLISVGLFGGSAKVAPAMIAMKAVTIAGSYVGSREEMREALEIARRGNVKPLAVSERPLADVGDALADLRDGRVRGRVVVRP